MKKRFPYDTLPVDEIKTLKEFSNLCRRDVLTMTTLSKSGHPGGSMSAMEIYNVIFHFAAISPEKVDDPERDKIVISFGHTSPGVYAVLGRLGFFDPDTAIASFRQAGSIFEGHIVRKVPGIDWGTGNLGQGLSAGCGYALFDRIKNRESYTFVLMSDGEQTKGQVGEARRFAMKYNLNNLRVIIDYNRIQISGCIFDIMPSNIKENYLADGWEVMETDGHDIARLYSTIKKSLEIDKPVCIIANTVIGKGVSFMEGKCAYHGKTLGEEDYIKAIKELGFESDLEKYKELRKKKNYTFPGRSFEIKVSINKGKSRTYEPGTKIDNRTAFGNALLDLGIANKDNKENPILVFDCDLASSVKTDIFAREFPDRFFQCGVQEHHAATVSGASSSGGAVSFFADFGVFGVDETYNQHRLNDQNYTNLKVICTHLGLDVGEDGKTHQCIDYIGLFRNIFGMRLIIPADPNQTDRVIRYVASQPGNYFVGMGRSNAPIITTIDGRPFFASDYEFEYGRADILRDGKNGFIYTMGALVPRAIAISDQLKQQGIEIGVVNYSCPVAIDENALNMGIKTGLVISYEDHIADSGLGMTIASYIAEKQKIVKFYRLGIRKYGSSGTPDELYAEHGLDVETVKDLIRKLLKV
ncbi:MAG: transketolase [Candidatus Omnitrophica bacterium]|nr:transketolase [Candidatus Omnitrophota bacterium]MCM8827705.1 transketolase [Candidatus Omnitrophota bacterium]